MHARVALLVALAIGAISCGGGVTKLSDLKLPNVLGTWTLRTINGSPPPGVVRETNPRIELLSDLYTFTADNNYSERGTQRTTTGAVVTTDSVTEVGKWIIDAAGIVIIPSDGGAYPAAVGDNALTLTFSTLVLVYSR